MDFGAPVSPALPRSVAHCESARCDKWKRASAQESSPSKSCGRAGSSANHPITARSAAAEIGTASVNELRPRKPLLVQCRAGREGRIRWIDSQLLSKLAAS